MRSLGRPRDVIREVPPLPPPLPARIAWGPAVRA
jgi:hypothetical protein